MFVFRADVKQVAAGDAIRAVVEDVQAVAAPHQHQLAKLVRVLGKDVLRIAIGHRHGLHGVSKEIGFAKD
ncbi:hypothetical protein D1872_347550 [compost metagenome]